MQRLFRPQLSQRYLISATPSPRAAELCRKMLDDENVFSNRRIDLFPWQNFAKLITLLENHNGETV